jgi:preflagellin peptidase FlaK
MYSDAIYFSKVIVAFIFLIQACRLDLNTRRVPNRLWKQMVIIFVPLNAVEFLMLGYKFNHILFSLIQFGVVFSLAHLLYYIGAYGGADAKAFMVLSLAFPIYPKILIFPLLNWGFGILAFSTLSNSVIFAPIVLLYMFARNLMKEGLKNIHGNLLYYFTGYRVSTASIPPFHNLLEFIDEEGKLIRVKRGREPDEKLLQRLKKAREIEKVWVTPSLPFLLFITIGFFISVVVGDLLFKVIQALV